MINKVGYSPVNFQGRIVKNDLLEKTIKFAQDEEDYNKMEEREKITTALDYIINKTPKKDVFELKHDNEDDWVVVLHKNNKPVAHGDVGASEHGVAWGCIRALEDFTKSENYERLTPTQKQIKKIRTQQDELYKDYRVKEKKIEDELNMLRQDLCTKNRGLIKKADALLAKEDKESIKDLNDICKRI